jgi:hypothetical protein
MSGAGNKTLKELGRWNISEMIDRYDHPSEEHLVQALERIASAEQNSLTVFTTSKIRKVGSAS